MKSLYWCKWLARPDQKVLVRVQLGKSSPRGRLWQCAHPQPLSPLQGRLAPRSEPKEVIVKSEEEVSFTSEGWYNYGNFEWNRIQTVDEFISGEDSERLYEGAIFDVTTYNKISDESREYLNSCKWVLRFAETEYMVNKNATGVVNWNRYIVGNVTILRLKFVTAGVTYNLGVVDNMQTGSSIPSNVSGTEVTLSDEFSEFLTALLIIVAIVILIVLSPIVFKAIKLIFQILFAPFKALFGGKSKSKSYSKKRR